MQWAQTLREEEWTQAKISGCSGDRVEEFELRLRGLRVISFKFRVQGKGYNSSERNDLKDFTVCGLRLKLVEVSRISDWKVLRIFRGSGLGDGTLKYCGWINVLILDAVLQLHCAALLITSQLCWPFRYAGSN